MHSEIFDEFVKIVQAVDEQKKQTPKDKKSLIKELADLYGLKPEAHEDMDYENNMAEIAHPDSLVISPSYDKSNGLVENVNEGHSLIKKVVTREPRGQHTNRRVSAKENLIKNLVRLGNELDFKGEEKLAILADDCLNKLSLTKTANPLALLLNPWVIGGALALLGVNKQLPESNLGLTRNTEKLTSELSDLLESNANWGVGKKYKPEFISFVKEIINTVKNFNTAYNQGFKAFNALKIDSAKDLLNNADEIKQSTIDNTEVLDKLLLGANKMFEHVSKIAELFNNDEFINNQVQDAGALTNLLEKNKVVNVVSDLIAPFDDISDIRKAFVTYLESLTDIITTIESGGKAKEQYTSMTEKMLSKFNASKENKK